MNLKKITGALVFMTTVFILNPQQFYAENFILKLNSFYLNLRFEDKDVKSVSGVSVTIESRNAETKVLRAEGDSIPKIRFAFENNYTLTISKEGYLPCLVSVDTHTGEKKGIKVNSSRDGGTRLYYNLDLLIPLCQSADSSKPHGSPKAVARVYFEPLVNRFIQDTSFVLHKHDYTAEELARICSFSNEIKYVDYKAKLVYGAEKNSLVDQGLRLKDSSGIVVQSTKTNSYGDFSFKKLNALNNFNIVLEKNDRLPAGESVFLTEENGKVTRELAKDKNNEFAYDLLSSELMQLTQDLEEDNSGKLRNFKSGSEKKLTISEQIRYAPGSWAITPANSKILMNLLQTLQQNPDFNVEIYSYTDASGDAQMNMDLSNKRAKTIFDFFVSKGIKAGRMKWQGFGQTKMLIRCTEFKLIKVNG